MTRPVGNTGNRPLIEFVGDHIERTLGSVHQVWDELDSDMLHLDVCHVLATSERRYQALVTCGMSEFPMTVPETLPAFRFAELAVLLPPDWPVTRESLRTPATSWPFWLLKRIAAYPHTAGTWLGYGHTVANPVAAPDAFPGSRVQDSAILLPSLSTPSEFWSADGPDGRRINFWGIVPLYPEERALAKENGSDALLERFDEAGLDDIVRPGRPSAIKRGWFSR